LPAWLAGWLDKGLSDAAPRRARQPQRDQQPVTVEAIVGAAVALDGEV
jgi:hypothetical protein